MKTQRILLFISLFLNILLIGFAIYFIIFRLDGLMSVCLEQENCEECIVCNDNSEVEEESSDTNTENNEKSCTEACPDITFEYTYVVTPTSYDPSENEYSGYRICDDEISFCTIYGVKTGFGEIENSNDKYQISFNEFECPGAAAGTKYCIVSGEVLIEPYLGK